MDGRLEPRRSWLSAVPDGDRLRSAGAALRLPATLIDMVVLCGLCVVLALPVARSVEWRSLPANFDQVAAAVTDSSWLGHAAGIVGMWVALWWSYFLVGWGLLGATPGKWVMGLRIVDHKRRCPIGVARAALRLSAYGVSSLTLGFGHLLVVLRVDRCALHDLLAGTQVVRRKAVPYQSRTSAPESASPSESESASVPASDSRSVISGSDQRQ